MCCDSTSANDDDDCVDAIALRDRSVRFAYSLPPFDKMRNSAQAKKNKPVGDSLFGYAVETGCEGVSILISEACGTKDKLVIDKSASEQDVIISFYDDDCSCIASLQALPSPLAVLGAENCNYPYVCNVGAEAEEWAGHWTLYLPRNKRLLLIIDVAFEKPHLSRPLLNESIEAMLENPDESLADFEFRLTVGGSGARVKAHKCILAQRSDVFRTMFRTPMKESNSGSMQVDTLDEVTLRRFLKHVYLPDAPLTFDDVNVVELAKFACMYGFRGLTDCCLEYMTDNVDDVVMVSKYLPVLGHVEECAAGNSLRKRCMDVLCCENNDGKCDALLLQLAAAISAATAASSSAAASSAAATCYTGAD